MPHESITLQKGSRFFIGRPAKPIAGDRVERLAARLRTVEGVRAAYLPMVFGLPGQTAPAQVLVVERADDADDAIVSTAVGEIAVAEGFTPIDVLTLPTGHPLLADAAGTGCVVVQARPWWKVW